MHELLGLLTLLAIAAAILLAGVVMAIALTAVRPRRETAAWAVARGLPADPEDAGLEAEAWTLRRPDGVVLHAWTITSPGPFVPDATRAPLLVLAHGWYRSRRSLLGRLGPFLPLADRVVLYDARGHGDSGGRSTLGVREPDDLLAVVEAAGEGPAIIGGWSLGATASLAAAAAAGRPGAHSEAARIAGVIAIAPVVDLSAAIAARMRQFDAWPSVLLTPVRLVLRWLGAWPVRPAAAEVTVPTLIVHGSRDVICPVGDVRRFAAALPRGRLLEVPAAGHDEPEQQDDEAATTAAGELVAEAFGQPDAAT